MKLIMSIALTLGLVTAAGAQSLDKGPILAWARENLVDPYSLRSTGISGPHVTKTGASVVCIEYNAKNQVGGYTGIDRMSFVVTPEGLRPGIRGLGGVTNATCWGPEFVMRPFPELAAIR